MLFAGKAKGKKPAKASVQAPLPVSLLTSAFTCQASVALADGSRLSRARPQTAPFLRFLQPVPSVFAAGAFFLLLPTHGQYTNTGSIKNKALRTGSCTNTPKHSSKGTGVVVKADKGTLRQPQKISTLVPRVVFFGLPLQLCPPACVTISIMFKCIFNRKLAGWWLVAYTCSKVRLHFSFIGGAVPVVSLQLLWLSCSIGKLPF
jgi:hypothetical protein